MRRSAAAVGALGRLGPLVGTLVGTLAGAMAGCEGPSEQDRCGVSGCRCLQGGCRAGLSCIDDVCVTSPMGPGGAPDDGPAGPTDYAGAGLEPGPELVRDGGFESWIEDTAPAWTEGAATRTPSFDLPFAGQMSARVRSTGESCVTQGLEVGIAVPEGEGCFLVAAAVRDQAGPGGVGGTSPPRLRLDAIDDEGLRDAAGLELVWAEGGAWRDAQAVLELSIAVHGLSVSVCGQGASEVVFGLDAVSVRRVDC